MLLPSILKLLDAQAQLHIAEQAKAKPPASTEKPSGLEKIEHEIAAAAELLKPPNAAQQPAGPPVAGPFLVELLRAITKFEKSDQSRVVDVFE